MICTFFLLQFVLFQTKNGCGIVRWHVGLKFPGYLLDLFVWDIKSSVYVAVF